MYVLFVLCHQKCLLACLLMYRVSMFEFLEATHSYLVAMCEQFRQWMSLKCMLLPIGGISMFMINNM